MRYVDDTFVLEKDRAQQFIALITSKVTNHPEKEGTLRKLKKGFIRHFGEVPSGYGSVNVSVDSKPTHTDLYLAFQNLV